MLGADQKMTFVTYHPPQKIICLPEPSLCWEKPGTVTYMTQRTQPRLLGSPVHGGLGMELPAESGTRMEAY